VYGFESELPINLRGDPNLQHNYDDFLIGLKSRLQTAQQMARERLIAAKYKSKEYYDKQCLRWNEKRTGMVFPF
jgi:hypothetical protein